MAERTLLKGMNILLVEDEMMIALLLESVLDSEGCNVVSAGHLEQAAILAAERAFDAAILDVNLHGKRSYPVADTLAARGIPFLFSTGYGDTELRGRYPDRPALAKPYKPDDLILVLLALLDGR